MLAILSQLPAGTILQIVLLALKFASNLFNYLRDNELIKQGEDQAVAKALAEISRRLTIIKAAGERVEKMSDKEVLDELAKNSDFRD